MNGLSASTDSLLTFSCRALDSSHTFSPEGGTFGRSNRCDWVLPDEDCILSAVHARVISVKDDFILIDQSTNGTFVGTDKRPIGRGGSIVLKDGMLLTVGHFRIDVRLNADDEQFGSAKSVSSDRLPGLPSTRLPSNVRYCAHSDGYRQSADPLDYLEPQPVRLEDGTRSVLSQPNGNSELGRLVDAPLSTFSKPSPGGSKSTKASAAPPVEVNGNPPQADIGAGSESGVAPGHPQFPSASALPSGDFIPEDYLDALLPDADAGAERSAMALDASRTPPVEPPPELPKPAPCAAATGTTTDTTEANGGAVNEIREVLERLRTRRGPSQEQNELPVAVNPLPDRGAGRPPVDPGETEEPQADVGDGDVEQGQQLISALMRGLGLDDAQPAGDHDEMLRSVGQLVRNTADGLTALLSVRRLVETTFRLDEIQIRPEGRNPYRSLMVGELVLDEMFLTRSGDFQPPAEATKEAFADMQYFTLITISALNRALRLLFEKLNPDSIGTEADNDGGPEANRRAYLEHYERMGMNFDTVAHQIIAQAFTQAQEERARKDVKHLHKTREG